MEKYDKLVEEFRSLLSDCSVVDLFTAVSEATGVKLSPKQLDYAARRDYELNEKERAWKRFFEKSNNVFSAEDFPSFVVDSIALAGYDSPNEALSIAVKNDLKRKPEVSMHFFEKNGKIYFDDSGYRWIISCAVYKDWVAPEDKPKWMEMTGLY